MTADHVIVPAVSPMTCKEMEEESSKFSRAKRQNDCQNPLNIS